jgi:3-oxoacyl-[acyl-carrier-protein] synthase-3
VVTNDDLSEVMETSDEWIFQRTGIRRRHVMKPDESLSELAAEAGRKALEKSGVAADEVGLVVVATSSPEDMFGMATATAAELGCDNAVAFDLTAACSGFVFALVTAAQYVRTGAVKKAVVIGVDALSRYLDWDDRTTCVLFGDGAGAMVIEATEPENDALLGFEMGSDGKGAGSLGLRGGCTSVKLGGGHEGGSAYLDKLQMNGKDVFRFATTTASGVLQDLLARLGKTGEDVDWLLLHQANRRIMDSAAKRLKIPEEKIICNLDEYGNTSAASIPLALDEAIKSGQVKKGHVIACSGFGAGLSWGGMLLRL